MTQFLPGATSVPGESAGASTGGGPKIVHHTTEGGSASGAISAFRSSRSWPTLTAAWSGGKLLVFEHMPLNDMARALEHPAGTLPTNTANCVQIEHVGFTDRSAWERAGSPKGLLVSDWPKARWLAIGALCRQIEKRTGCPAKSAVPAAWWRTPQRLGQEMFVQASGHCGHVHVPSNHHTDGEGFHIETILVGAGPLPADPCAFPGITLQRGSRGSLVKHVQGWINTLAEHFDYNHLDVDGAFGPATEAGVKTYQRRHDLTEDGVVGPVTWVALCKSVKASAS
jgi:peptidoglycan hydrolase-like protein with peptidoglycan-binding domain